MTICNFKRNLLIIFHLSAKIYGFFRFSAFPLGIPSNYTEAEELSSRLMHTIIDIRNDDSGRVVLEEAKRDRVNPFDLQCIYFEDLLREYLNQRRWGNKPPSRDKRRGMAKLAN